VEALAEGEQFVGFGCHPQTERPYEWSAGSPLDVPFADLPETDADRLSAFVREAEAMIRATGAETRAEQRERIRQREEEAQEASGTSKHEKPSRATVEDLLRHIPNDCTYDEWVQVGFALYDGLGPEGKDVWEAWSAQSPKNEAAFTAKKWDSFSKPGGITVGTLFWLARRNGWGPAEGDKAEAPPASISAEPFAWCDPRTIPLREWLLGRHYIKRFVSVTVAPGGVGKSSLAIAEALAMTSGRDLLGEQPASLLKVWYWNGEDPLDELQRRVMATAMHYDLGREDVEGRLFLNSGRQTEIVIAEQTRNGITIAVPVVEAVKRTIVENGIDVVIIDPFVSSHRVSENDNNAIDRVAKAWGKVAEETNCAVELVHHARKTGGNEVQMEDARGAVALISASRTGRILNAMTREEAERAGVERRRLHFRVDNGKANLAPPPEGSDWFKLASVPLGNGPLGTDGDSIGVVTRWKWPDPLADLSVDDLRRAQAAVRAGGPWRENVQAADWVGKPIAQALGIDLSDKLQREKVKRLLRIWIANGMFVVVTGQDEKSRPRPMIEVGEAASD
ncbi:AAA family ATPase, partial [Methylobacterium dankookense]